MSALPLVNSILPPYPQLALAPSRRAFPRDDIRRAATQARGAGWASLEKAPPDPGLRPAAETLECTVPLAEHRRQITPRLGSAQPRPAMTGWAAQVLKLLRSGDSSGIKIIDFSEVPAARLARRHPDLWPQLIMHIELIC